MTVIPKNELVGERMRNLEKKEPAPEAEEKEAKARRTKKEPGSYRAFLNELVKTFADEIH